MPQFTSWQEFEDWCEENFSIRPSEMGIEDPGEFPVSENWKQDVRTKVEEYLKNNPIIY